MKIRDVQKIVIEPKEQSFRRAAEAFEKLRKGEHVTPSRTLGFSDVVAFRKFFTERRIEMLHAIRQKQPESVYELAKLLNRDLKSVNTDLAVLKRLDLVQLEKRKLGRTRVIPRVLFDKMQVNIAIA